VTPLERQKAVLQALGRIEDLSAEVDLLKSRLESLSLWRPAAGLSRQCAEALRMIRAIGTRLERNLVVTVIGPSGSGKSTLVNALAGGAELSPAGHRRPTTGALVLLGSGGEDAAELTRDLGAGSVEAREVSAPGFPAGLCLIDTPDTDSTAFPKHLPALQRVVAQSDVLVCVFDAENPKRRDHADFLAPLVHRFDGESLVAVLNKCDRLDLHELNTQILPDFREYLRSAWHGAVDQAWCVSARRHLQEPGWDPSARPRHDFDQFEDLRRLVFGLAGHGRHVIDRRVDNARQLQTAVLEAAGRELQSDRPALAAGRQGLVRLQGAAMQSAAAALQVRDSRSGGGLSAAVYQKLCMRWVGPVGWVLAVWTRLMVIGSGIAAFFRLGRSSDGVPARRRPGGADGLSGALQRYRRELLAGWPAVAELLVRGRFDAAVRSLETPLASADRFEKQLAGRWEAAIDQAVEHAARRLAGVGLQFLMNAPVLGILGYVGWSTVRTFFSADYLGGDYFVHAFWVIAIALLLSFFALQALIRLTAGPERILAAAFDRLQQEMAESELPAQGPLHGQLDAVLSLAEAASVGRGRD
jgi:energy-coupling factor transporter ATP-binding protein EcfA2